MEQSLISEFEAGWARQRPDLDAGAVATAVRLELASRRVADAASRAVEALGLEWWEYDVLSALRRSASPMSASALARASMLSTSAMTNRIDRLEERALIQRTADTEDRRRTLIRLTPAGMTLMDRASAARFAAAEVAVVALTTGQREQLDRLLEKLIES